MHVEHVHGGGQVILICANRTGYQGLWYLVGPSSLPLLSSHNATTRQADATSGAGPCKRFRQGVDLPEVPAGARAVPLTQGKFALVDAADYQAIIKHSWCITSSPGRQQRYYAVRRKKGRTIGMHRAIMKAGPDEVVDHINHNGLDNRRSNLRICTHAENMLNTRARRCGGTSRYKGVSRERKTGKWRAVITHNGKYTYIGRYTSETAAAKAYNAKAQELFGEFAYLNNVGEASSFGGVPSENQ